MAIDTEFVLGYGGFAKINDTFVPYTNASVQRQQNVVFQNTYHVPFSDEARSRIRMNKGTFTFSGNIDFQLTENTIKLILDTDFLSRTSFFDIVLNDGQKQIVMLKNMWQSLTINSSVNSIPTCSISFVSLNDFKQDISLQDGFSNISLEEDDSPISYWNTGNNDSSFLIQSFNFTFNRNVTSAFLNNGLRTPSYLRAGIIDCSMSVQCFDEWFDKAEVSIGSKKIKLLNEYIEQQNWTFVGNNESGSKSRTIKGTNYSNKQIFEIS